MITSFVPSSPTFLPTSPQHPSGPRSRRPIHCSSRSPPATPPPLTPGSLVVVRLPHSSRAPAVAEVSSIDSNSAHASLLLLDQFSPTLFTRARARPTYEPTASLVALRAARYDSTQDGFIVDAEGLESARAAARALPPLEPVAIPRAVEWERPTRRAVLIGAAAAVPGAVVFYGLHGSLVGLFPDPTPAQVVATGLPYVLSGLSAFASLALLLLALAL